MNREARKARRKRRRELDRILIESLFGMMAVVEIVQHAPGFARVLGEAFRKVKAEQQLREVEQWRWEDDGGPVW